MDIEKVMEKVRKELPPQPCVRLTVEKGEAGIFGSKLGGTPYSPRIWSSP